MQTEVTSATVSTEIGFSLSVTAVHEHFQESVGLDCACTFCSIQLLCIYDNDMIRVPKLPKQQQGVALLDGTLITTYSTRTTMCVGGKRTSLLLIQRWQRAEK